MRIYTTEKFIKKATSIHRGFYLYSKSIYVGDATSIVITCPIHGDFQQTPNNHYKGRGCKQCGIVRRDQAKKATLIDFLRKSRKVHADKYDYSLSQYTDWKTPLVIICKAHGAFKQRPHDHYFGKGCPKCSESVGERTISNLLLDKDISFKKQYKIPTCRSQRVLAYDFAIFKNEKLCGLIEYQGKQHYKPFGKISNSKVALEEFKKVQLRDQIKQEFCKANNIPLLLIPYTQLKNIEMLIDQFI